MLLAGCAAPARPDPDSHAGPTGDRPYSLLHTPTLDQKLSAMIVETSGSVIYVHDPTMIEAGGEYYLVSTGPGIPIRCSKDMLVWEFAAGQVFDSNSDRGGRSHRGCQGSVGAGHHLL